MCASYTKDSDKRTSGAQSGWRTENTEEHTCAITHVHALGVPIREMPRRVPAGMVSHLPTGKGQSPICAVREGGKRTFTVWGKPWGATSRHRFKILSAVTFDPAILLLGIHTTDMPQSNITQPLKSMRPFYSYIPDQILSEKKQNDASSIKKMQFLEPILEIHTYKKWAMVASGVGDMGAEKGGRKQFPCAPGWCRLRFVFHGAKDTKGGRRKPSGVTGPPRSWPGKAKLVQWSIQLMRILFKI